ncbi:disease resistance protein RPS2 isoform X3 [Gossypium hirsutum]|uniref:Disease resistance protein RPS2 isoform X3 n=1 Tax=Gossypium hirsutum TaxID=3635 RepID=A0ABM2Z552_GOSHI|nr:disease resistance protein RPS2-like isoform X3 [Gossypium hirsutum]XP_040937843.1 disease resistance protein RPS2-like isoform X3 [Gossypium hirsutum]XP_040937844.1 disease resistance protein RPS2-like isoform X3 [Gossypium hirsutum]
MGALASILESLASKAAEYMVDSTPEQLGYLFNHESKFQNLWSKVQELKDARQRVQQSVDEANRNGEKIFHDVERWLTMVNDKISDQATTQLQEDEKKAMESYFAGFLLGIKSRYHLSKKAEKEMEAITQLLNGKDQFDRVSYRSVVEGMSIRPVKEYEAFGSRSDAFNGLMAVLNDDNVNIIGVYGMGGVGKTTLVKEAARQIIAKEKKLFDEVILVAITQASNNSNIQNEITEKLGLKIEERSVDVRAARLHDRLKKINKVLIILDDIWEEHDLDALGIPSVDKHKGLKISMTSRRLEVLKSMGSQKSLPIDILKEDEAWNLFKIVAGPIAERSDLQSKANEVAQKCAGLPIAIATVAKALKHKENLHEWEDALEQLKPSEVNCRGVPGAVYSAIEMSYKYLKTEDLKSTFLLCSIMGHNAAIEDLLKYCTGLGLFHGLDTIQKVRNRVLTLVSELEDSSLLLAGSTPECFGMHDVVCDVAISIASGDRGWLALGKEDVFEGWSDVETMRNYNLVSLQHTKVSELSDELECPNLTFFAMVNRDSCLKIPNNFFKGMKRLKVLSLEKVNLSSVPSSIGSLRSLCTLRLIDCGVEDIVMLGELVNLEILDLRNSGIRLLPKEIGQLRRLKLLDLSYCYSLKVVSPNVLSSLSRLEELYFFHSFDRWEVEGSDNLIRSNASLVELQHLSRLTTLKVRVPNEQAMPEDNIFLGKLERYKICIGDGKWYWTETRTEASRMLKLKMKRSSNLFSGIKLLLRKTESLYVDEAEDVREMLDDPVNQGLPHLKHLKLSNVSDMKFVIGSRMFVSCLESLDLHSLMNLESICEAQLKAESFGRLRFLEVSECKMLKNLFSFSIAKRLRQLEEIEVSHCNNMREFIIVEKEEEIGENDNLEFPQLRSLSLRYLPTFNGAWYSQKTLKSVRWLFGKMVLFPVALEELYLDSVNGIKKIWHDDQLLTMPLVVHSLTRLEVWECHKLKCAFTSCMVKSFVQLETLIVSHCDEMENVIEGILGGEERINNSIRVFPKLNSLKLNNLSNLKRFCCGINSIEFPFLRKLEIKKCPVLSAFHFETASIGNNISFDPSVPQAQYLFSENVIFPVLKKLGICCGIEYEVQDVDLDIRTTMECELEACRDDDSVKELVKKCLSSSGGMENVERLWPNQLDEHSYSKLTSFFLEGCRKLLNVFPLSMLMRLQKLENLSIWNCESLEEIICESQSQEINVSAMQSLSPQLIQSNVITFEFSCLPSLTLIGLPNLKSICHKTQAISWHLLKKMEVYGCNKVEILFASQEISGNINEQPLFWVNKFTFPNLHQLTLGWNVGVKEIWRLIPSSISFQNLIILEQIDMVEKFKNSEEYLSHLSTSNSQNDLIKEYENSEKDQSNPCKKQKRHGT